MNRILIIGATSAIAHETAKIFAQRGAELVLAGRDPLKLAAVASDLEVRGAKRVLSMPAAIADPGTHAALMEKALEFLGAIDAVLIAHGSLSDQRMCETSVEATLAEFSVNCLSVIALCTLLANYFEERKGGCLAIVGSVAGDRGRQSNYVYGTAKGAIHLFAQGLRNRLSKAGVRVLTIKPGFVDTPMTAALPKGILFAAPGRVAKDIVRAMERGTDVLYTPWFWRGIMLIIRSIPERIFKKLKL